MSLLNKLLMNILVSFDDEDDVTATKSSNKLLAAILNPNQRLIVTSIQKNGQCRKIG